MTPLAVRRDDVDPRLRRWLENRGGRASFEQFFEAALYDPATGYYSNRIRTVGRRGDFSTSATLDPALPAAIAGWIVETGKHSSPAILDVLEMGAGDGTLADAVLGALPILMRRRIRYHIVDRSEPLRARQRDSLRRRRQVRWHESVQDALTHCEGRALIFSNELFDAFAPRVFQWSQSDGTWGELVLHLDDEGNLVEHIEPANPRLPPAGGEAFPDGQRIERHDSIRRWLGEWSSCWRQGEMLAIDYGDEFPRLYHRRPRGTLRAYFHHQRFEAGPEIYQRFGSQDLTCDVDFTFLSEVCRENGLEQKSLLSQGEFIRQLTKSSPPHSPMLEEARSAFKVARFRPAN